jgi:hypothetical protein
MRRTLENCRLIKRLGPTLQYDGVCEGFGVSEINDEPCRICKNCRLHYLYYDGKAKPEPKRKRKFTWDTWDYDCCDEAYIIAKDECPNRDDVPVWIVKTDNLDPECLNSAHGAYIAVEDVKEGWCKYQVRTDWENGDGEPLGGYFVVDDSCTPRHLYRSGDKKGKRIPGWFPVWIVRKGEWY